MEKRPAPCIFGLNASINAKIEVKDGKKRVKPGVYACCNTKCPMRGKNSGCNGTIKFV